MLDRQWRVEFEAEQRRKDEEWRSGERAARETFEKETIGAQRRQTTLLAAGIFIAALVAIFAALIQAGLVFDRPPREVPIIERTVEVTAVAPSPSPPAPPDR